MNIPTTIPFVSKVASSVVKQYQGATKGLQSIGSRYQGATKSLQNIGSRYQAAFNAGSDAIKASRAARGLRETDGA
jgi:hypothetical protein